MTTVIGSSPPSTHVTTVEEKLALVLRDGASTAAPLGSGYRRLWESLTAATEGGKRSRPALFVTAYRAWGGADDGAAAAVGAAIELLHTAFVVHDDVIDGDDVRRGRLNVSGSHRHLAENEGTDPGRARDYAVAAGILAGDLALVAAVRTVATCGAPAETVARLLDLFDDVVHTTAAGELLDVRLSTGRGDPTLEQTVELAERKTGEYSFALPLQAAAILAEAPRGAVAPAGAVGRALGVAYQLVDDVNGMFGDPAVTGKSCVSDLRSGKQTPLVAHARATSHWPAIAPYVGLESATDEDADRVRGLLEAAGSRRFVEDLAAEHVDRAVVLAHSAGLPAPLQGWITGLSLDALGQTA